MSLASPEDMWRFATTEGEAPRELPAAATMLPVASEATESEMGTRTSFGSLPASVSLSPLATMEPAAEDLTDAVLRESFGRLDIRATDDSGALLYLHATRKHQQRLPLASLHLYLSCQKQRVPVLVVHLKTRSH